MEYQQKLTKYRNEIDLIDKYIYVSLLKRVKIIVEIANLKKENGVTEMCPIRRKEIFDKLKHWAIEDGLPTHLVLGIFEMIVDHSTIEQTLIINDKELGYLP